MLEAAAEWGIGDDIAREHKVEDANEEALAQLVALIDAAPDELWSWLAGPESFAVPSSPEYVAVTCLTMAADSARVRLRRP